MFLENMLRYVDEKSQIFLIPAPGIRMEGVKHLESSGILSCLVPVPRARPLVSREPTISPQNFPKIRNPHKSNSKSLFSKLFSETYLNMKKIDFTQNAKKNLVFE